MDYFRLPEKEKTKHSAGHDGGAQAATEAETGVKGHIHRLGRGSYSPQMKTVNVRNDQGRLNLDSFLSFDHSGL